MKSKIVRQRFIDFFVKHGHVKVPSSSLIPADDPTLLFANAGMNQFKDVFLGKEKGTYSRAVTAQKCVRAGGKHNDLENVGFTKRHLTFFEMLGNFSFGDYFKREAIAFAWEFLTHDIGLPAADLYISVYEGDMESFKIWHEDMGIPAHKIYALGQKDNFWAMGDLGPCGPCTEIHIDRGPRWGCPTIEKCGPACDCDRFLEIWNLVFMQYDRQSDGTLKPLARTGVDTGMGLERLCAILQEKDSVFDTDVFTPVRQAIERVSGRTYDNEPDNIKAAFRVLEDHIRSSSMLIADGCVPSNEGRGYVVRKIVRRAALFARKVCDARILPELSAVVVAELGDIYPELTTHKDLIELTLAQEVEKFADNLERGELLLEKCFQQCGASKMIPGAEVFRLYDTYGFPEELVVLMAHERGFNVDREGFKHEMERQQERSGKPSLDALDYFQAPPALTCEFVGYDALSVTTTIEALVDDNAILRESTPCDVHTWVVTKQSPFFVLGGGQAPDRGWFTIGDVTIDILDVRLLGGLVAVAVRAPRELHVGDPVCLAVAELHRGTIMRNHTASHLVQAALMEIVDKNIKQAGSYVAADYLRFDFSGNVAITHEQLNEVERRVNEKIQENVNVCIEYLPLAEAKKRGALAFFEQKYTSDNVRIVSVPGFSAELCCGTHVRATGDIGVCKIVELKAISAGVRRIVAVTGMAAFKLFEETFDDFRRLGTECKVAPHELWQTVVAYKEQIRALSCQVKDLKKDITILRIPELLGATMKVAGVPFLAAHFPHHDNEDLRDIAQKLAKEKSGFYLVMSSCEPRTLFVAAVSADLASAIVLKDLAAVLKSRHDVGAGGSRELIQGGGIITAPALEEIVRAWISREIGPHRG